MDKLYYVAIERDDKREFIYTKEILEQTMDKMEVSKDISEYLDVKPLVMIRDPSLERITVVSKDKQMIGCFCNGMSFEKHKYEEWDEMYNEYIDQSLEK
mgnify:CR=1 FL=1|tara:strand:+ start:441 stop:737 length:297 start_codon:yes stop_codon:yes gene_type:complete